MENPIEMDDLGVPLFSETAILFILTGKMKVKRLFHGPLAEWG